MTNNCYTYFGYPEPEGCRKGAIRFVIALVLLLVMIVAMFGLAGCKDTKPIAASHYRDSARVEKVYVLDSVYVDRWHIIFQNGDTICRHDSIVKYIWRVKEVLDTLKIVNNDTITIRETIEKPLSGGTKFLIGSGVAALVIVGIVFIAGVVAIVIRVRRRRL